MIFWTVENGELVAYERTGECRRCGACCYKHRITYTLEVDFASDPDEQESEEDFDWSCREGYSMFRAQGAWWYIKIIAMGEPHRCPYLTKDNKCSMWQDPEEFRPICRYWPFHPTNLEKFPECGFKFERLDIRVRTADPPTERGEP